jgi:hypothetical protein
MSSSISSTGSFLAFLHAAITHDTPDHTHTHTKRNRKTFNALRPRWCGIDPFWFPRGNFFFFFDILNFRLGVQMYAGPLWLGEESFLCFPFFFTIVTTFSISSCFTLIMDAHRESFPFSRRAASDVHRKRGGGNEQSKRHCVNSLSIYARRFNVSKRPWCHQHHHLPLPKKLLVFSNDREDVLLLLRLADVQVIQSRQVAIDLFWNPDVPDEPRLYSDAAQGGSESI